MRLVELVDNDHIPVLVCRPGGSRPVVESGRGGLKSDEESADEQPEDCCPIGIGWLGINVWVSVQAPLGHLMIYALYTFYLMIKLLCLAIQGVRRVTEWWPRPPRPQTADQVNIFL